jgi:Flp pilus assembly protein TadD
MFAAAAAADSGFADAHAGYASAYISIADNILAPRAAYPPARAAAARALRIDPANGEATAALAKIALWYEWDLPGALLLARHSVALNPASAETHVILGMSLLLRGDTAEAGTELRRAIDLDSLSGRTISSAGFALMMIGENDAIISRVRRFQAAGPHSAYDRTVILRALDGTGHCAEVDSLLASGPQWQYGAIHCHAWTSPALDSSLAVTRQTAPYLRAWTFARYYAKNGNPDRAFEMLEQAFRDREAWMPFIQYDAAFASLRTDPRFQDLVHRVAAAAGAI